MTDAKRFSRDALNAVQTVEQRHLTAIDTLWRRQIQKAGAHAAEHFAIVAAADWQPPVEGVAITEAQLAALAAALNKDLIPIWTRVVLETVNPPLATIEISWDVMHPAARRLIDQAAKRTGARLDEAVQFILRDTIQTAYEQGLSVRDTSALIQNKISDAAPWQADMLARSDLNSLANGASKAAASEAGIGFKTWLATLDDKTRVEHAEADGQTVPIDDTFLVGGEEADYPGDPALSDSQACNCRCVSPGTPISGAIYAGLRRVYEGEVVRLVTASGRDLAVTPNHPILTRRGWVAAGQIVDGDDLICRSALDRSSGRPDVDDMPAEAHERFATLRFAATRSERVDALAMNFHGEIIDGEVDVVWARDDLALKAKSPLAQHLLQLSLALAEREVSTQRDMSALISFSESDGIRSRAISRGDVLSCQDQSDGGARDAVLLAERQHTHAGVEVGTHIVEDRAVALIKCKRVGLGGRTSDAVFAEAIPDRHGGDALLVSDLLIRHSGEIETDPVINIERQFLAGHVYNFSSETGTFEAAGVITANCTLVYGNTLDEAQALLSDAGGTIMADMASTRTRAKRQSRRAAKARDGQGALLAPDREVVLSASDTITISDDSGPLISVSGDALAPDLPEEEASSGERKNALVAAPQAIPFDGVAAIEGKISDDNSLAPRVILPNALSWPEMPVSFLAQTVTAEGHDGAEVAGRVDSFARKRAKRGMFDIAFAGELTTPFGVNEIAPMIEDKTMRYVSADLGASEWVIVDRKTLKEVPEEDLDINALQEGAYALGCTSAKIKAATLLAMQALEGAMVSLTASADESGLGIGELTSDEIFALVASGSLTLERDIQIVCPQALALDGEAITASVDGEAITASVDDWSPPREWFDMPELPGKMPLTVTKDGRVYGHLACWDSCHVAFLPSCMPPPKSASNYAYFHVCEVDTDEGDCVTVGKLMFSPTDGGHADRGLSAAKASRYYDRTGMVAAFGRVSDGAHGIWFAGSINPRLTPEQRQEMRRELRMNPPSGDWRPINGQYELICGLAVAVPGFPTPRSTVTVTASAEGFELQDAIIASSGHFDPDPQALFVAVRMGIADEEAVAERRMRALAARAEGGIDALAALAGGES